MAENVSLTKYVQSEELRRLFVDFKVEIPEDPSKLSFAKKFLQATNFAEFVAEVKSFASTVVLYKKLGNEDKKPGTVYVCEVVVRNVDDELFIEESGWNRQFFFEKNENLIKVILIKSSSRGFEVKRKVYQKYKQYFPIQTLYLHQESEEYDEIAKLSAHKKICSYKHAIESIRDAIPLQRIGQYVKDAVDRALERRNIIRLCYNADIQECGNANRGPYNCRSIFTITRIKEQLIKKTLEEISICLESEIRAEIQKHVESEFKRKLGPNVFHFDLRLAEIKEVYKGLSFAAIGLALALINPIVGLIVAIVGGLVAVFSAVDVNSQSWRNTVANEIFDKVFDKKQGIVKELTLDIKRRCEITAAHLETVIEKLEELIRRIHLIDQQKLISEWEKPEVKKEIKKEKRILWIQTIFKDENVWKKHGSISGYIHGIKHDVQIVKFFLKYDDKKAKLAMEKNISKGLITEFIVIPDRIEEIKRNLAPITAKENSARSINAQRRSRIDEIIRERATDIYRNHSDVFGLRISNVRNVGGALIEDPCIVIYCLDKSFIPANENKLPTEIDGYKCDIRENIIMFGGGGNLGSSIGTPYGVKFGSIGFFAKSNFTTDIPASGFLTAAHVAITELDRLHDEKALLTKCRCRKRCEFAKKQHFITQPAWPHSDSCTPIGEVVESFFGNYKSHADGKLYGIDAAFINTYPPKQDVEKSRHMQIVEEKSLNFDNTIVIKRGITTGDTEGWLMSDSGSACVKKDLTTGYTYQFDNCYVIKSTTEDKFFDNGDSGSAVFVKEDGKLKPLGIAFAFSANGETYACRIDKIVQAFNLSILQEEEDMETSDE